MWIQKELRLKPYHRGFHLITDDVIHTLGSDLKKIQVCLLHVFITHTSASLTLNENADPTVRTDFERFFNHTVPENEPYYQHTYEGSDDMPAHLKSSLLGPSVQIPITNGHLNLGAWQGIYLCEHRNRGGNRMLILTAYGENHVD